MLSLEHVAKTHYVGPYEKATLVDVSLALSPGDFVGVWGGRRAGKSTLLRICAGLEPPDHGAVRFDGTDLATLSRPRLGELRLEEIGLALGDGPRSAELTIGDYLALPLLRRETKAAIRHRVREALRQADILECRNARWSQLSDTEQALASLAHALVRRPRLLLVDDPASRMDLNQDQEVITLLRRAAVDTGVAVLMTTSSMSVLTEVHQAFTLGDGRLLPVPTSHGSVIAFRSREE